MFNIQIRVHTLYLRPLSVRAQYRNLCSTNSSSHCHGSLRHLNGRTGDRRQVEASYIFCVWFRLVQYCVHFHFRDYEWFLFVFCTILLCNRKSTELGKLHVLYPESMCDLENCQWCGEPCFALATISTDRFLHQIPRRDRHKSLQT
jgi:hypothetical protein